MREERSICLISEMEYSLNQDLFSPFSSHIIPPRSLSVSYIDRGDVIESNQIGKMILDRFSIFIKQVHATVESMRSTNLTSSSYLEKRDPPLVSDLVKNDL